jgi:hypothetical protein
MTEQTLIENRYRNRGTHMTIEHLEMLADSIEVALGKGHRGYTIRGAEMDWVVQALRHVIERSNTKSRAPLAESINSGL